MKKTINFDVFAQLADAQLSKEEMKMIKGGTNPEDSGFEGGNPGGGSGTGGGGAVEQAIYPCGGFRDGKMVTSIRPIYADSWADAVMACQNYWGDRNLLGQLV